MLTSSLELLSNTADHPISSGAADITLYIVNDRQPELVVCGGELSNLEV